MKKIFYFMMLVLLSIGCSKTKEVDLVLGADPDARISDTLMFVKKTLVEAPNGWKAYTNTNLAGGYGFYMDFAENDRLKMIADLTSTSAKDIKESTYRIRQIMGATLSFDTYNYLTMLQDPNPNSFDGVAGKGLESDVEYEYLKTHGDTVFFSGRRFKNPLTFVKATAEEKAKYVNAGYLQAIERVKSFFVDNEYPYVEIDGAKYQIAINDSKLLSATTILPGNIVQSTESKFYFDLEGVTVSDTSGFKLNAVNYSLLRWEGAKLYLQSTKGDKLEIKNSIEPLMPLHLMMGSKYSGLYIPFNSSIPGSSAGGMAILNRYFQGLGNRATGYYFNCGELSLDWNTVNKRITLGGFSSQDNCTGGWTTTYVYDYTLDNATGAFKLTRRSGPAGGYTAVILDQMHNLLINNSLTLDYFIDGKNVYANLKSVEDPAINITFMLY